MSIPSFNPSKPRSFLVLADGALENAADRAPVEGGKERDDARERRM
jgi:hypothetical protein